MTWYSLLPEQLTGFETWIIRFFVRLFPIHNTDK